MHSLSDIFSVEAMLSPMERMALARCASRLPEHAVIIDLGTSAGGSADLFLRSTALIRDAHVLTIDIEDKIHGHLLHEERLTVFRGNAADFVKMHKDVRADLIFIDASHYFFDAASDFSTITGLAGESCTVAFHDCIWPKFPGIMGLCKTLADNGNVRNGTTFDSLFIGELDKAVGMPKATQCAESFGQLGSMLGIWLSARPAFTDQKTHRFSTMLDAIREGRADAPWIVGQGQRGKVFSRFLGIDSAVLVHSGSVTDERDSCIVCSHSFSDIYSFLRREKGMRPDSIVCSTEIMQYGFYQDLLQGGQASVQLARTDFQKDVIRGMAELPKRALNNLYRFGCLENILEDVFLRAL